MTVKILHHLGVVFDQKGLSTEVLNAFRECSFSWSDFDKCLAFCRYKKLLYLVSDMIQYSLVSEEVLS